MKKHLMLNVDTVENNGLLVHDKVNPVKRYVFVDPHSFYKWLCSEMEVNAKSDSHTTDGRVVIDYKKLEKLTDAHEAFREVYRAWLDTDMAPGPLNDAMFDAERGGYFK